MGQEWLGDCKSPICLESQQLWLKKASAWNRTWDSRDPILSQPQVSKTHVAFGLHLMLVKLTRYMFLLPCQTISSVQWRISYPRQQNNQTPFLELSSQYQNPWEAWQAVTLGLLPKPCRGPCSGEARADSDLLCQHLSGRWLEIQLPAFWASLFLLPQQLPPSGFLGFSPGRIQCTQLDWHLQKYNRVFLPRDYI